MRAFLFEQPRLHAGTPSTPMTEYLAATAQDSQSNSNITVCVITSKSMTNITARNTTELYSLVDEWLNPPLKRKRGETAPSQWSPPFQLIWKGRLLPRTCMSLKHFGIHNRDAINVNIVRDGTEVKRGFGQRGRRGCAPWKENHFLSKQKTKREREAREAMSRFKLALKKSEKQVVRKFDCEQGEARRIRKDMEWELQSEELIDPTVRERASSASDEEPEKKGFFDAYGLAKAQKYALELRDYWTFASEAMSRSRYYEAFLIYGFSIFRALRGPPSDRRTSILLATCSYYHVITGRSIVSALCSFLATRVATFCTVAMDERDDSFWVAFKSLFVTVQEPPRVHSAYRYERDPFVHVPVETWEDTKIGNTFLTHHYYDGVHSDTTIHRKPQRMFRRHSASDANVDLQPQGFEENVAQAREALDAWKTIATSKMWLKIKQMIAYATYLGFHGDVDDETLEKIVKKHKLKTDKADMTYQIMDFAVFVCERGYQSLKANDPMSIFHSGSSYEKWFAETNDVMRKVKCLHNPEVFDIDEHKVREKVDELIEQGECIIKYTSKCDRKDREIVQRKLTELTAVRIEYLSRRNAMSVRKAPFSCLIEGHSSVAKTTFGSIVNDYYAAIFNKDNSDGHRYNRTCSAKFWDGFDPCMWSVTMDDVAYLRPDKVLGVDPSLEEILQIKNNNPMMPDMASLDKKGMVPMKADLLIATTNCPDLNLEYYFQTPYAIARRFPYHIRVAPKKEYRDPTNPTHLMEDPPQPLAGEYEDWWDIMVLAPQGVRRSESSHDEYNLQAKLVPIFTENGRAKIIGMREFLPWLYGVMKKHDEIQRKILVSNTVRKRVGICTHCHLPSAMCECECREREFCSHVDRVSDDTGTCLTCRLSAADCKCSSVIETSQLEQQGEEFEEDFTDFIASGVNRCVGLGVSIVRMPYEIGRSVGRGVVDGALYAVRESYEESQKNIKESLERMATHVTENVLSIPKWISRLVLGMAAFASMVVALRYIFPTFFEPETKTCEYDVQGGVMASLGQRPRVSGERESVWYNDSYEVCSFDMNRMSLSWKGLSDDEVHQKFKRQAAMVEWVLGTEERDGVKYVKKSRSNCLAIGGQYFLSTTHATPFGRKGVVEGTLMFGTSRGITQNVKFLAYPSEYKIAKELVVFKVSTCPPFKDTRELFPPTLKVAENYKGCAMMISRDKDGGVVERELTNVRHVREYVPAFDEVEDLLRSKSQNPTVCGDCGSVVYARSNLGPFILGIHQLGKDNEVGTLIVTREMLEGLMPKDIVQPGNVHMESQSSQSFELVDLSYKSPIRYVEEGTAKVYGSFSGFRASPKSSVSPTLVADYLMENRGWTMNWGPPVMRGYVPWRRAMLDLSHNHHLVRKDVLQECMEALVDDWMTVDESWRNELMIYDDETAINGRPGMRYVDGINRRSSAGFPWRKSKRYLTEHVDPFDDFQDPIELDQEVMDRVHKRLEDYAVGKRTYPVFTATLKDEPLKKSKIAIGKTRVFMVSPVDFTIVMRKLLLSFVRVVQKNKFIFEQAPGTEAQTVEWDFIRDYLCQFGEENTIFGDFRGFDITMIVDFMFAAFEAMARFHELCGCSEMHVRMIRTLAFDICFALCDFNGDLVEFFGKNPSGQALTVILNGIVNCLYMRYTYYEANPEHTVRDFKQFIALITYGDDNGMGVHPSRQWFNHSAIADSMARLGVTYTMADKEAESVPYINIREGSFLKRSWRFDESTGAHVCPLDEESIKKMLMIGTKSRFLTNEVKVCVNVHTALSEYFWYGRDKFNEMKDFLTKMLRDRDLMKYNFRDFDSYDDYLLNFKRNSREFLAEYRKDSARYPVYSWMDLGKYNLE